MISSKDRNEIFDLVTQYSFAWDSSDADRFQAPTTAWSGEMRLEKRLQGESIDSTGLDE